MQLQLSTSFTGAAEVPCPASLIVVGRHALLANITRTDPLTRLPSRENHYHHHLRYTERTSQPVVNIG